MSTAPSRTADKFIVRLPDGLRDRVLIKAYSQKESMNALVIKALERYLDQQDKFEILLDLLAKQTAQNDGKPNKTS
jgi:hypothetical protein